MDYSHIEDNAGHIVKLLKSISNERRLIILCALNCGEKSVGELEEIIGLSQSALSQHLARLRRDKLVSTRREAQTIYYSVASDRLKSVMDNFCDVIWTED